MATLFEIQYSGQADGVALTTGNTGLDTVTGTNVYSSGLTDVPAGFKSALTTTQGSLRKNFTSISAARFRGFALFPANPSANVTLSAVRATSTNRAQLRIQPDGAPRLVNVSTAVGVAGSPLTNTPFRWEWALDGPGGTQTLYIFAGTNIHGTTPDQTLTGAFTNAAFDNVSHSNEITNTGYTVYTAELKGTDTPAVMIGSNTVPPLDVSGWFMDTISFGG